MVKSLFPCNSHRKALTRKTRGPRTFLIATDNTIEHNSFFGALKKLLIKDTPQTPSTGVSSAPVAQKTINPVVISQAPVVSPQASANVKMIIKSVKGLVPWLVDDSSSVAEFWKYWMDSTPSTDTLELGQTIQFMLVVSANTDKLSWRVYGAQIALIQNMVDFFWNVGAPDEEIDHLNNLGCQINPTEIGSWIDMSVMNGMDGGWFFRSDLSIDVVRDTADKCEYAEQLISWAKENGLNYLCQMGRDMGATPPRLSEFRFKLDGVISTIMDKVHSAFTTFGFPPMANDVEMLFSSLPPSIMFLYLCITVCSEGFVKINVLVPNPPKEIVTGFISCMNDVKENNKALHEQIENKLGRPPMFVEYSFLKEGYGYDVYKEGPDVHVHYDLGRETR